MSFDHWLAVWSYVSQSIDLEIDVASITSNPRSYNDANVYVFLFFSVLLFRFRLCKSLPLCAFQDLLRCLEANCFPRAFTWAVPSKVHRSRCRWVGCRGGRVVRWEPGLGWRRWRLLVANPLLSEPHPMAARQGVLIRKSPRRNMVWYVWCLILLAIFGIFVGWVQHGKDMYGHLQVNFSMQEN